MRCPKCDHTRPAVTHVPAWQCPHCGVAYDKVGARTAACPDAGRGQLQAGLSTAICCGLLLSGALLGVKALYLPVTFINSMLLVPFFFTVIPVLTRLLLGELWCWDRDKACFVRFNLDDRPLLGNLITLFFAVAGAIFAVYFFRLDR